MRVYGPFNFSRFDVSLSLDIVDIKPVNMEELTEVITATEFHPTHCNQFMYSSSKANIKLADMRDSALCDRHAKCEHAPSLGFSSDPHRSTGYRLRGGRGPNNTVIFL